MHRAVSLLLPTVRSTYDAHATRFIALAFLGKFVAWPALAFAFIVLDQHILGWLSADLHHLLMMMAIVPPAANIATYASHMNLEPEKAATTILVGTVFALFYIPIMVWMLGV